MVIVVSIFEKEKQLLLLPIRNSLKSVKKTTRVMPIKCRISSDLSSRYFLAERFDSRKYFEKWVKLRKISHNWKNLDCEQSLSFPSVFLAFFSAIKQQAASGEAARSAGGEEKEKERD